MHDTDGVRCAEPARCVLDQLRRAPPRQRLIAELRRRAAAHVLHDEIRYRRVEAELVDLHDVRMRERRHGHRFPTEAAIRVGVAVMQDLERDGSTEIAILGEIDTSHAAGAERPRDREAPELLRLGELRYEAMQRGRFERRW